MNEYGQRLEILLKCLKSPKGFYTQKEQKTFQDQIRYQRTLIEDELNMFFESSAQRTSVYLREGKLFETYLFAHVFPGNIQKVDFGVIKDWIINKIGLLIEDSLAMENIGYHQKGISRFYRAKNEIQTIHARREQMSAIPQVRMDLIDYDGAQGTCEFFDWNDSMNDMTDIVLKFEKKHLSLDEYAKLPELLRDKLV